MQLTQYSDIGLRLLMYLAHERKGAPAITLAEVASQFNIRRNHLAKVAAKLTQHGWVGAIRGRSGGLYLALDPSQIRMGHVLKVLEGQDEVIDCEKLRCVLRNGCELRLALAKAYAAFFDILDQYTLADLTHGLATQKIARMQTGFMQIYLQQNLTYQTPLNPPFIQ